MAACLMPVGLQGDSCAVKLGVLQGACLVPSGQPSRLHTCSACPESFNRARKNPVRVSFRVTSQKNTFGYPEEESGTHNLDLVSLYIKQVLDSYY